MIMFQLISVSQSVTCLAESWNFVITLKDCLNKVSANTNLTAQRSIIGIPSCTHY